MTELELQRRGCMPPRTTEATLGIRVCPDSIRAATYRELGRTSQKGDRLKLNMRRIKACGGRKSFNWSCRCQEALNSQFLAHVFDLTAQSLIITIYFIFFEKNLLKKVERSLLLTSFFQFSQGFK